MTLVPRPGPGGPWAGPALGGSDEAVDDTTNSWRRVPAWLRVSGLVSACALLVGAAVYVLAGVATRLTSLSVALFAAMLITALLQPAVDWLSRRRIPRWLGAAGTLLALVAVFVTPAVLLWRLTMDQFGDLSARLQQGLDRTVTLLAGVLPMREDQIDRALTDVQARIQQLGRRTRSRGR